MSPFEFVFALISIISSLALTKIITGVVDIVRHEDRGRISLTHALWMWVAFALVIANWGAFWGAGAEAEWPAMRVLAWIASMTALYAFSALVVPDVDRHAHLDLAAFHEREGRRYIGAHNVFALVTLLILIALRGIDSESVASIVPPAGAFVLGMAALLTRGWTQLVVTALIAIAATVFMFGSINIISTAGGR